jgi:MFS transporter, FHS family, glucose/mannose:H+ symporter
MLLFGITIAVPGSVLPQVIIKFRMDMADAGSLLLFLSLGVMFGSMVFGPVADRHGYRILLIISSLLISAGILGIAFANSLNLLRLALYVVGFAGGVINGATNAMVSDISGENRGQALSFLAVFFGIGALLVPVTLGTLLDRYSYETLVAIIAVITLIPLASFALVRFPLPRHGQGFPFKEGIGLTKETTLVMFGALLFLQSGLEMTIAGWSATFLHQETGMDARKAVFYFSFYWVALIIARLALGKILIVFDKGRVLYGSILIALSGSVIMLISNRVSMAIPGLVIMGLGFAAIFPLVLSYVGDLYSKLSGTAFSMVLALAIPGGMVYPYLTGILANHIGLRLSLYIVPVSLLLSALVFRLILIRLRKA